jgi:UPF0176 protein
MSTVPATSAEILSGYGFVAIAHPMRWRERIRSFAAAHGLKGTVIVAGEGLNFSLAGSESALDSWLDWIAERLSCSSPIINRQPVDGQPFLRLKVKVKDEIVKFDRGVRPIEARGGRALMPAQWNALIDRDDVQLVDARNDYEVRIGTFEGALNPGTDTFAEFKSFCLDRLDPKRPVAMFCTGGVRCEKASAWLESGGFEQVFHLHGGVLAYLAETAPEASRWRGECFVFDDRVSVDARLRPTGRIVCRGCRRPAPGLDAAGVPPIDEDGTCRSCGQVFDRDRLGSLRERARQVALARSRGEQHLGPGSRRRT